MNLFIEFHLIQNFAPSNLNRDDTGAPKDAIFGGHRRARVSSQCFKRAIRLTAHEQELVAPEHRGVRTKKLKALLLERLAGRDPAEAEGKIETALAAAGLKLKDDGKTEYLLFLGEAEIAGFAALIEQRWDELGSAAPAGEKKGKKEAKANVPTEVIKQARALLDGGKAVDVALFGRMLADLPEVNQDAACQVAHAISTHRVEREFDYFTAVDDRGGPDESGAGMIGQVEFNSATLYRYAVVDLRKLLGNLQNDGELVLSALEAFTQAMVRAIPSGKQNTFAAHNLPAFVGVCLRHAGPLNLANAFEKPVVARADISSANSPSPSWPAMTSSSLRSTATAATAGPIWTSAVPGRRSVASRPATCSNSPIGCAARFPAVWEAEMATLLMRLQGPMQSWGTTSRFDERDTQLEPSKSGVLGLVCAALGRDRSEPLEDLASLRMGVRVDREGIPLRDYQTATGVLVASGKADPRRTVVSPRHYLADAVFLVGLEGRDQALLERIQQALRAPFWPLCLGRKSFVPGSPVWLPEGLSSLALEQALQAWPRLAEAQPGDRGKPLRCLIEDERSGVVRLDQPIAPFAERRFGPRFVRSGVADVPDQTDP